MPSIPLFIGVYALFPSPLSQRLLSGGRGSKTDPQQHPLKKQAEPHTKHSDNRRADRNTNQTVEHPQKQSITNKNSPKSGQKKGRQKISAKDRHKQNTRHYKSNNKQRITNPNPSKTKPSKTANNMEFEMEAEAEVRQLSLF